MTVHGPHLRGAQANEADPRFCQKVYDESSYFKSFDPVDFFKSHAHYEVTRAGFRMALLISGFITSTLLFTYAKA